MVQVLAIPPATRARLPVGPAWWILERSLDRYPDRVALRYLDHDTLLERESGTYAELATRARSLAAGLQRLGIGRGARVTLCLPNSPALITSFYGVWLVGATVVPINPMTKGAELRQQLGDADVALLIASSGTAMTAAIVAGELRVPGVLTAEVVELLAMVPCPSKSSSPKMAVG
jgi:long-chain acyl-CoA synthetase